jgi:hypothetical protein
MTIGTKGILPIESLGLTERSQDRTAAAKAKFRPATIRRPGDSQIRTSLNDLLDRAGRLGEYSVGVRANHANRADHEHKDHGEHNGVFGDILALIIRPESRQQGEDGHSFAPFEKGS